MKKISAETRYTTEEACNWSLGKFKQLSCNDRKHPRLKKMNGKIVRVVIKIYDMDDE